MRIVLPELTHLGLSQSVTTVNGKMNGKFFDISEHEYKITSLRFLVVVKAAIKRQNSIQSK